MQTTSEPVERTRAIRAITMAIAGADGPNTTPDPTSRNAITASRKPNPLGVMNDRKPMSQPIA